MKPGTIEKIRSRSRTPHNETVLARLLRASGRAALRRGKLITGIAVALVAVSIAGIYQIQINDNPVRWFKANHPIRVADEVLNEHFAGTYDAFVVLTHRGDQSMPQFRREAGDSLAGLDEALVADVRVALEDESAETGEYYGNLIAAVDDALFEADSDAAIEALTQLMEQAENAQVAAKYFQRPEILSDIASMQQALADSGYVGKTNALPDVVKVVNRELRGGDDSDYRIPDTVPAVAQTLLQYQSSHRPQDLWHMVTPDYTSTAIWLQLKSGDNQDMNRVMTVLDEYLDANPLPSDVEVRWAGKTYINVVWQDAMVNGMLKSLIGAFAVVFIMMTFLFRSVRLGALAMVPLSLTILGVYGVIGWVGKDYDMPIAVLSALTLGLSIDFAIHFIERARSLLQSNGSFDTAMKKVFEEPARAIARNAIVIAIGFTPLFFAPLVPYITVGAFMAAIMALSGVTTLVLLPALMSWCGPWLFPKMKLEGVAAEPASA